MEKLIEIKNLNMQYSVADNFWGGKKKLVYALNNVDLDINKNEILGLVGESGCGKSTLGKCILRLIEPTSGEILFNNQNILNANKKDLKDFHKRARLIFQNPYMSLNPKMKIYDILREPFVVNGIRDRQYILDNISKALELVSLDKNDLMKYPHEFSGGQRQRIAIARAIILNPEFIVADEPVSALDVSIQAQIINMLVELREKLNLTMLFVSHDLNVVKYISDRVAVMYLGEIVEIGKKDELFSNPQHPYTKALLNAIPQINDNGEKKILLSGDLPSPQELPKGCKFCSRCPYAFDKCQNENPNEIQISSSHKVKCFLIK